MKLSQWSKTALIGLSAGLVLAACGNEENGSGAAEGQTELVFWHGMGGNVGEALDTIVNDFNESQDEIYVEAQYQGTYDETLTNLRSAGTGGNVGADIVQVFEQGTQFMIDSGLTVPVQDYVDQSDFDPSNLEENLAAYYTIDGTLHSMPFNSSTPILYYNQDYFDQAGLEVPANMEEVMEIGPELVENSDAEMPFSLGIYGWYIEQWHIKQELDMYNNGDGREGRATEVVFDDNGGMESVLNMWKEGQDAGVLPNVGREGGGPEFVSGQAAMTVASTANLNQFLSEVDGRFEVGTAYYPSLTADDDGGVSIGGASLWMIDTEDQEKMDATWEFIEYLISPEIQAQWHRDTGYFPVTTEAHQTETFQQTIEEFPQYETAINQLHDSTPEDQGAITGVNQEARQIYEAELEQVLGGGDVQDGVSNMAEQVNSALENYNATLQE